MRGYKLITLIISGLCVVLFVIIGMNVFGLNNKDDGYTVDRDYVSINEKEQEPPIVEEVVEQIELIKQETKAEEVEEVKEQKIEIQEAEKTEEVQEVAGKSKEKKQEIIQTDIVEINENNKENKQPTALVEYTGNKWVNDKIVENIDHISEVDIQSGLAIGDKIDTDLVMAYLEDGLTDDEKESLSKYLKSVLSSSEYETVKVLRGRYSGMLD